MVAHTKLSYGPLAASVLMLFAMLTMPMEAGAPINGSCCGQWVTIKKDGSGFDKNWLCEPGMKKGTPEFRAGICKELRAKGKICDQIAPYCPCSAEERKWHDAERDFNEAEASHKGIWKGYKEKSAKLAEAKSQIDFLEKAKPRDEAKLRQLRKDAAQLKREADAEEQRAKSIGSGGRAEAQKIRDNAQAKYLDCMKAAEQPKKAPSAKQPKKAP
jgi:hypothetical protein